MLRNAIEPWHLIVVALVLIMLFGSKKLPDAARGLGKSMRILKSEARALKADDASATAATASTVTGTATASAPADAVPAPGAAGTAHTS
ncbi:Sec-independent protein translocase subunit TatA [Streptomyces sp. H10-C2]|uniref:Sec-independent protein translocase subunit TatA n=1 Tax=unclassified Streptomyces TaxID=2593676 RepID=UPI0024B9CA10|nr:MULTISPECIES: Sec-independent protein translocase subunit TatA [unclassified Streptomyces]MDJ0344009.1 Sec-independent protein translocase subunit TatA [Streptomyces sp. PH10-H1]MDJ0373500.1 Sec-independent protein translocase subunit TatA [Streptomyces sp. H10-C2]